MVFSKLKERLTRSRENISYKLGTSLKLHPKLDDALWEEIEEVLISADVGVDSTVKIVEQSRREVVKQKAGPGEVNGILRQVISDNLKTGEPKTLKTKKQIILVTGVNGTGKTTTIAKLAEKAIKRGDSVILAAADTFRAAAIEQLTLWAQRLNCQIISHQRGSDAAAVVYDAVSAVRSRKADYLIVDTAGRLHTQTNLMEELKKIKRIADKEAGEYEVVVVIVLDANTGQNALIQAKTFNEALNVDEIILTKLDSTAKGGIVIAITDETSIPIGWTGLGEKISDLEPFDPQEFASALLGT